MKNIKLTLLTFASAILFFTSCEDEIEAPGTNYVTFETDRTLEVEPDGTSSFEIMIYSANTVGSERTFNVILSDDSTLEASEYTLPTTVTIPAQSNVGKIDLSITDNNLNLNPKSLILNLEDSNGAYFGNGITLSVLEQCLFNKVTLDIDFDAYSEESSWSILDASNAVVASNSYVSGMDATIETLCIEDGAYTFVFYDSYGDGLDGTVTLSYDGTSLVDIDGFGGTSTSQTFTIGN